MEINNPSQPEFVFRKEREFGEIISDSFGFFTQNYKTLSQIFLKFIGPYIILMVIGTTYYQYKTGDLFTDITLLSSNPEFIATAFTDNLLALLLFVIVSIVATIMIYATVLYSIKSYIDNNGEIIESDISQGIKKDFFKILGYILLSGIVSGIGSLFCLVPGIYLYVVLFPGLALMVMEDLSISDAFSKSFKLIKDNWWITFATILVFTILISILGYVFQVPALIYSFVEGFTAASSSPNDPSAIGEIYQSWVYLLFSAIGSIGQYFLSLFSVIMLALVYFNLSEKQEFKGTYNQIDQIGN
mgnify:CR=1 FL=1